MTQEPKALRERLKELELRFDSPYYKAPLELDDDAIDEILSIIRAEVLSRIGGEPGTVVPYTKAQDNFGSGYAQCVEDTRQELNSLLGGNSNAL